MVGGSGSLNIYNYDIQTPVHTDLYKNTDITISPSIGYFIIDKLALGLKPSYLLHQEEQRDGQGSGSFSWLELGAFGRWYFLKKENNYNIVSEISYYYGLPGNFSSNQGHSYSIKALMGHVLYFNSSVGIELLVGYNSRKELYDYGIKKLNKGFLTTIGFQIHLKKGK